jgi:hypothetical protein
VQNPPTWNPLPEVVSQLESLLKRLDDFKDILRQEENRLKDFYQRLVGRGKPKKVALIAADSRMVLDSLYKGRSF